MSVYLLMIVYVFVVGYFGSLLTSYSDIKTKYNNRTYLIIAILSMALPVFIIGVRTDVMDTSVYINGFNYLSTDFSKIWLDMKDSKGPAWLLYEWAVKRYITKNAVVYLTITAAIQAGGLIKFYYKHSEDYPLSILLFFLSGSFFYMLNGMRQFMAVTFILYFVDWLFEKKYVRFILIVIVAVMIHSSAIIWIIVILVACGKPWNKKTIILTVIMLFTIMCIGKFTSFLDDMLMGTLYDGIVDQFENDDGSNFIRTIITAIPVVLSLFGRQKIAKENNNKINVMVNISIINMMFSLLANFTSGIIMGRLPIYFSPFMFSLYPWLFNNAFGKKNGKLLRILCVFGYVAFSLYYLKGLGYISDILNIDTTI